MDWNLKANSWGLGEFEQEAITGIDALHRPSGIADHSRRGDFSIDLKLGGVGKSSVGESVSKWKQQPGPVVSKLPSSPSGLTKRARGGNNGIQAVTCLVDGCNSDLSASRDYHRRHKVCELHSKTPQVTIYGQKQRFCQQCSRFHSLEEFDEGKRSCRKRLDGHNRRRRKPQPELLSRPASFLSNFQGSQLFPFSGSHAYPPNSIANPCWSGGVVSNSAADTRRQYNLHQQIPLIPNKHNLFLGSSSSNHHKEGKQFPFLQSSSSSDPTSPKAGSVQQPVLRPFAYPEISSGGGGSSHNMYCERLTTQAQVRESDCALSLLSSKSSHMVQQPNSIPLVQYSIAPATTQVVHHGHCSSSLDSVLVSSDRDAHCQGMFHIRSGVSSGNKASQPFSFSWE